MTPRPTQSEPALASEPEGESRVPAYSSCTMILRPSLSHEPALRRFGLQVRTGPGSAPPSPGRPGSSSSRSLARVRRPQTVQQLGNGDRRDSVSVTVESLRLEEPAARGAKSIGIHHCPESRNVQRTVTGESESN